MKRDRIQSGIGDGVIIIEAQEKSGTMHTADFAVRQKKKLACYAAKLLQFSSGNKYLEESKKAHVLDSLKETSDFLDYIVNDSMFDQMTLKFD